MARYAGRIRTAGRLVALRPQPRLPLARLAHGCAAHAVEKSLMTFDRAWVLALAWLPLAWMVFEWRRTTRRLALVLKAFSLVAILIALSQPRLNVPETKGALAVLVDTSASVSPADLQHASQIAGTIANQRGRNWMR